MATAGIPRILVVDDDQLVRRLVRTLLERAEFDVVDAVDGAEGLRLFRQNAGKIDLLLTDIVMPGMTGPDLVQQIRLEDRKVPILFMSAYCDTLQHSMRDVDCLVKPFSNEELVTKV